MEQTDRTEWELIKNLRGMAPLAVDGILLKEEGRVFRTVLETFLRIPHRDLEGYK